MFFISSKILDFLLNPLAVCFIIVLLSFISKFKKHQKLMITTALVFLFVASNPFIVDELYRVWDVSSPDSITLKKQYPAAVVLGGIGEMDLDQNKITFKEGGDRLFQTLALLQQGQIKKLVFTGGSGSIEFPEHKEGMFVKAYLKKIQIPDSLICVESESRNTYENAVFTKPLLRYLKPTDTILLVTSSVHMRRSLAIFKKCGYPNCVAYATNLRSGKRRWTPEHLLVPNAGALQDFKNILHEWVGYCVYSIKGYI